MAADVLPTFERDIQPILTRSGCNAGACHGKARGQNGFALSLLGYDADFDFDAITREGRGRRLFAANPDYSLLLRKASAEMAHGGGKKLPSDGPAYRLIRAWIAAGTPRTPADAAKLERISVVPVEILLKPIARQSLKVTAHYSDGSTRDVTALASFQSNDAAYAAVDADGLIKTGPLPGEAAINTRFMDKFAVSTVLIPRTEAVDAKLDKPFSQRNFIDGDCMTKWKQLALPPSAPASETTLHRRLFLDIIGRLPKPEETLAYLKDTDANKREKLIDRLLQRPEYADFWANKWADLLRPNPYRVGIKAVYNMDSWLREAFRNNMPYDQFARELVSAKGSTFRNGAVVLFRDRREPEEITTIISQLFLGVRLECAKCHQHPSEAWTQRDFYSFAAYFARIGHKGVGLSPPISGGEEIFYTATKGEVKHPHSGEILRPMPLLGKPQDIPSERDPRDELAKWMTAKENPFFAKVMANRVWAELMGRGMVDPVDDLRASNPPSNGPLLEALADDFRNGGYDIKKLIRTITNSGVYSLSSIPQAGNEGDNRNYTRHYRQRLRAEIMLDAVSDITAIGESFEAMPAGSRAIEVWTARIPSTFLDSFSRPDPNQDPPCERMAETTVVQALHLMNGPNLHRKVTDANGTVAKLAKGPKSASEIVDELYLATYCRKPTEDERSVLSAKIESAGKERGPVVEDILWALLNTPEFLFKD